MTKRLLLLFALVFGLASPAGAQTIDDNRVQESTAAAGYCFNGLAAGVFATTPCLGGISFPNQTVSGATSGGVAYFNSSTKMSSSGLLAQYGLVVGGGAGNPPQTITPCAAGQFVVGQAGANPICATPASVQLSPSTNPTGTTSTTGVMMGLSGSITPAATGRLLITVSIAYSLTSASYYVTVGLRTGTGAAPVNGAALTGTIRDGRAQGVPTGSPPIGMSLNAVVTGLAIGTPIWFDLSLATSSSSATATITNISISAIEF